MTNNGIPLRSICRMLPNKGCALTLGMAARVLRLLMPLVFGALVNDMVSFGSGHGNIRMMLLIMVALVLGELLVVLLGIGGEKVLISSFATFSSVLKGKVWTAACKLPQLEYDQVSIGEWEKKLSYDVEMVTDAVRGLWGAIMNFAVTFLGTALIVIVRQPLLGIAFFMVLSLNVLTNLLFKKRLARVSNLMRKQFYREGTSIYSCIEMQQLLRAFSLVDVFTRFFSLCANRTRIAMVHNLYTMADFRKWLQVEFWIVKAIVLCGCMWAFCRGTLSMGAVVSFTMLVGQLIECVSDLMTTLPQIGMGYESSKALWAVLVKAESERDDSTKQQDHNRLSGEKPIIVFDNVSFHYMGGKRNVVEKFTTNIHRNEFICFLGRNGAGKSTLAKLMLGQYKPTIGQVKRHVMKQAWVSQRITIFEGSIFENIRLRDKSVPRQDVMAVIELCGLMDFIRNLDRGIDTHIKAGQLSGGELQAIGIARALVRNPNLLVVDEVSNNLDIVMKQKIHEILYKCSKGRTVILVSHDIESIRHANRLFFFGRNGIVELPQGTTEDEIVKLLNEET